jgi:hypothetical protein
MIEGVDVPMMCRGKTETWEKEPWCCSASEGCYWCEKEPSATTFDWLAGLAAPLVWWGERVAAGVESIRRGKK